MYSMSDNKNNQGVVKWYNNKTGYGFIKYDDSDVFVYHSAIVVEKEQFRYLVEGEYVSFSIEDRNGKQVAANVCGVGGGRLMCETRNSVPRPDKNESVNKKTRTPVGKKVGGGHKSTKSESDVGDAVKSAGDGWTSVVKGGPP